MSLEAPATVSVGATFTLCVNADPAPDVEIAGFSSEVVFPDGLKWLQRACFDALQVGRLDGGAISTCDSFSPVLTGGAAHIVASDFSPPNPVLNIGAGSTTTLLALDFSCNEVGSHKLTLTAVPNSPDGASYIRLNGGQIAVKTVNQVADTLVIECVAAVGGLVVDLDGNLGDLPLETSWSSGTNAGLLAGVVAAAAAALALSGAAWYARRRWVR